jgi:hypothetical protein
MLFSMNWNILFEIDLMNENTQKHFENIVTNAFKQ